MFGGFDIAEEEDSFSHGHQIYDYLLFDHHFLRHFGFLPLIFGTGISMGQAIPTLSWEFDKESWGQRRLFEGHQPLTRMLSKIVVGLSVKIMKLYFRIKLT